MGNYTPEQIDACILAYKAGDLNYCRAGIIDLLTAYAATLRQQAGRVDEGMVALAKEGAELASDMTYEANQQDSQELADRAALVHRLAAALAQNTQGEAVAFIEEYDLDGRHCRGLVWADHPSNTPGHTFTPLTYLHAERARVPDCGLSAVITSATLAGVEMDVDMSYFGPNQVGPGDKVRVFVVEKAAAPSQRAEAK